MRSGKWSAFGVSLIAAATMVFGGGVSVTAAVEQDRGQITSDRVAQQQPTPVVPSDLLPPGFELPPGVVLPPGFELPPGIVLPPGADLPAGDLPLNVIAPGISGPLQEIMTRERPAHGAITGFGESSGAPTGAPMRLSLRPGWQLTSIRGGAPEDFMTHCTLGNPSRTLPECAFDRGMFQVTLHFDKSPAIQSAEMRIAQVDDGPPPLAPLVPEAADPLAPLVPEPADPLAPLVPVDLPPLAPLVGCAAGPAWSGWVLDTSGDGQNVWLPVWTCLSNDGTYTVLQDTPRGGPASVTPATFTWLSADAYELTLSGFCLNSGRHVPGDEHAYNPGVLSDDAGLNRVLQAIKGKRLQSFADRQIFQMYLWAYADGGELTDADWSGIAHLN